MPRREVVARVEHDVSGRGKLADAALGDALRDRDHFHQRVDRGQRVARGVCFHAADRLGPVHNLPLQVGEIHFVAVA